MIIKSLSRATKSFEALYKYLTRDSKSLLGGFNLYSNVYDKDSVVKEFFENARFLKKAKGKNYLYHEIISLNKNNLSLKEQSNILSDLVTKYISLRAENHLVFTALHTDKKHTHIHLMISSNEIEGTKRVRLSKKDFSNIQKELEQYANSIYPQLGQTKHYNKDLKKIKSKKEQLILDLENLFKKSKFQEDFLQTAKKLGLEFYVRGKNVGVIYDGKKYRLKTLGLLELYEKAVANLESKKASNTKEEKVDSNQNEAKIHKRREEMKKARAKKYKEAKEKS